MILQQLFEARKGSLQDIADQYHQHFNEWPIDAPLVRIMNYSDSKPVIEKTRAEPRTKSVGRSGELQRWLKAKPLWHKVPDRDYAMFCSTVDGGLYIDMMRDGGGYETFFIIPKNGTMVAIVPEDFNSIEIEEQRLSFFTNKSMHKAINELVEKFPELKRDNIFDTMIAVWEATKDEKMNAKLSRAGKQIDSYWTHAGTLAGKYLAGDLAPPKVGIRIMTTKNYKKPKRDSEAWFVGEYLKVPTRMWSKFLKAIEQENE